jgi:hypothetical protein
MNKNRKLTIVFAMLGPSFIAGGIALNEYLEYSSLFGWMAGLASHVIALKFATKWERIKKN